MKSLDQILSEYVNDITGLRDKLLQCSNVGEWTVETRDEKMSMIRDFSEQSSLASVELVKYLVETQFEGKPLIYWVMLREALSAELDFLMRMREDVDITVDDALEVLPVDYNWITVKIRERIDDITKLSNLIEPELESPGTTEEV